MAVKTACTGFKMSNTAITKIYENLFQLESGRNGGAYPIHKKLVLPEHRDIYDWLSKKYTFPKGAKVLDVGCGVGFGTLLLAQQHDINITGISLSPSEIEQAQKNAEQAQVQYRVNFAVQSFDEIRAQYDVIIAVESVKHSLDLDHTLQVLKNALKPDGQLIIVEDFYHLERLNSQAKNYIKDWSLSDAFRESDYLSVLDPKAIKWQDMTTYMTAKRSLPLYGKLLALTLGARFRGKTSLNIYQIFRGGIYLDLLYAGGLMSYKILHYQT